MKVLNITVGDFSCLPVRISVRSGQLPAVALATALLGCHAGVRNNGPALAIPPIESIALRVQLADPDSRQLIRTILSQNGYQVHAEDRHAGWMRTNLGGLWEDRYRYRQWHIVVTYTTNPANDGTLVVLRAYEVSTSYAAGVAASRGPLASTNGFTRVAAVTDITSGEARQVWVQMERLAIAITDRGAELLTELGVKR